MISPGANKLIATSAPAAAVTSFKPELLVKLMPVLGDVHASVA
jgi:hypothetical protein